MKISNSKKQLAKIISENGGWPEGAESAAQCNRGEISFWHNTAKKRIGEDWCGSYLGCEHDIEFTGGKIPNWHQTVLSRDEYFHLYPAPDAISPMDFGVVDDFGRRYGSKPTIEQLAAEYRNRKDYAERKQQEADEAKAEAEAKLAELVAAGKAVGLALSVAEPETELVITDWRDLQVGDEIEYLGGTTGYWIGRKGVVELISGKDEYPILFRDGEEGVSEDPSNWDSTRWCNDFRFIRRPAKEVRNA